MRRVVAVAVLCLVAGCAPDVERAEVLRVPSPDGVLDAVVVQSAAGAASPFGYVLTLPAAGCGPTDAPVLRVVGATRSPSASGVAVAWAGPRTVRMTWLDARFRDPGADSLVVPTTGGPVTVVSGGGVVDVAAPPGGMVPGPGPTRAC